LLNQKYQKYFVCLVVKCDAMSGEYSE